MNITILPYVDTSILEQQKQAIAEAERQKAVSDFNQILGEASSALSAAAKELKQTYGVASQTAADSSAVSAYVSSEASSNATGSSTSSGTLSCSPELESYFAEAASTYGVDINLLKSIGMAESGFDPSATSKSGAMGVMQLMPSTASSFGVSDAYNARENILGGANLISQLLTQYNGDISLALAAYNAGSGNVAKYGGIPPFTETQNYVVKVLGYYADASKTANSDADSSNVSGSSISDSVGSSDSATVSATAGASAAANSVSAAGSSADGLASIHELLDAVDDPQSVQEIRDQLNQVLAATFSKMNVTQSSLEQMVALLKQST